MADMPPSLADLRLTPAPSSFESLVDCLTALCAWCGQPAECGELLATTGIAGMLTAAPAARAPVEWPWWGRHVFIEEAALLYGLQLRDLHPPQAAPLPLPPPEFDLHYRDSYLPLIRTALANGQPVLAWMGWEGAPFYWGLIVEASGPRGAGLVPGRSGRVALSTAPVQCYVVTPNAPEPVTAAQRLAAARRRLAEALGNALPERFGVISGAAALPAWREALSRNASEPTIIALFATLACARMSRLAAAEWLARQGCVAAGAHLAATAFVIRGMEQSLSQPDADPAQVCEAGCEPLYAAEQAAIAALKSA